MYRRISLIAFSILFLVQTCFALDVSARSAILYEPETRTVLFAKDSETKRQIASTTKIMTAVVVLEHAKLTDMVTVPKSCVGIEGTSMYLKENEKLSVSDLLYGLLLRSGNDAAVTLAYHVGDGDVARFVDMMNKTAEKIGMKNTVFKNPSGLPDEEHVSTAYDMACLAAYAMKIPEFAEIAATKEITVAGRHIANHNKMLRIYSGANGVKTGYTKSAGRCLVSGAERRGMQLIAVTLSAPDDWDDHTKLLDFGFDNYKVFRSPETGELIADVPVVGGVNESVPVVLGGEIQLLQKTVDNIEQHIYLPHFMYAPVSRGDIVGEIRYVLNGEVLDTVSLVCDVSVAEYSERNFFDKLLNLLGRE